MRRATWYAVLFLICLILPQSLLTGQSMGKPLTKNEYTVLKICEGIHQLFKYSPDDVWLQFNLARQPFIVYIPEKWALLFNYTTPVDGFTEYPKNFPDPGCTVQYHQGSYKDLIGQLAFDFEVDTIKIVAIGIKEENINSLSNPIPSLFGYCVHEGFHQYQTEAFGEIPWEREERYPILDSLNTSLAYIEMRLLIDALQLMKSGKDEQCRKYLRKFVAIRNYRWQQGDPYIARYEQGQELHEGTARYVEMKALEAMKKVTYQSSLEGLTTSLHDDFNSVSFPDLLIEDLKARMTEHSIQPEDMLRNRIYPVGSAMGFLLDYFGVDWKPTAQLGGAEFTFEKVFTRALGLQNDQINDLVNRAKIRYDYSTILHCSDSLIENYLAGYTRELTGFDAQAGYRIQIDFTAKSLNRSRSSISKKWLVDNGKQALSRYQVYTLKNIEMALQVKNSGVYESIDWDAKKYSIVFFSPEMPDISVDDKRITLMENAPQFFQRTECTGENIRFSSSTKGTIEMKRKKILIVLNRKN